MDPQPHFRRIFHFRLIYCSTYTGGGYFTTLPFPVGHNVNISNSHSHKRSERSARVMILRAATKSSLNVMMSSAAVFQELRRAAGAALAYGLSWRVMARQYAERKLLMVYTSIFNVFFLALSVFCCGQVWIEAPVFHSNKSYYNAERNSSSVGVRSGTELRWFTAAWCGRVPVLMYVCVCAPKSH